MQTEHGSTYPELGTGSDELMHSLHSSVAAALPAAYHEVCDTGKEGVNTCNWESRLLSYTWLTTSNTVCLTLSFTCTVGISRSILRSICELITTTTHD